MIRKTSKGEIVPYRHNMSTTVGKPIEMGDFIKKIYNIYWFSEEGVAYGSCMEIFHFLWSNL